MTDVARALDLCVDMNEPELLMSELLKISHAIASQQHPDARHKRAWVTVSQYAKLALDELRAANETP